MRRTGHRAVLTAVVLLALWTVSGCSRQEPEEEWLPAQSALQAPKEGPVTETLIETLDEDYYDSAELEKMVRDAVSEFDSANGPQAVEIISFTAEGKAVNLTLNYRDMDAYNDFNQVKFFNGPILEAQMEGFLFDCEFYHVDAGMVDSDPLPGEIPLARKQYQVFISDTLHAVEVPGDIVYISTNAKLLGSRVAAPADEAAAEGGYLYVIYEF